MASDRTIGLQRASTMTPAAPRPVPQAPGSSLTLAAEPSAFLWNVPMVILCLLILNHFGRPFEFFLIGFKIPFVICVLGGLVVLTTGGLKAFNSAIGIPLLVLIGWMLAATPFSSWRGGSARVVLNFVGLEIVLFLLSASAPRSLADLRKAGYVLVGSYALYAVVGSLTAHSVIGSPPGTDERLGFKGTFGNSDDLALLIGFTLPFVVLFALRMRSFPLRMLTLVVGTGIMVRAVLLTGTRAALAALGAILVVYFLRASGVQRVGLAAFALVGAMLAVVILPSDILKRFATLTEVFNSETVAAQTSSDEAMASVADRKELLEDALRMIRAHPLLGVGPGEYPDYRVQFLQGQGGVKRYYTAHNSYLEVAAENGIPALFCYLAFLGAVYWTIRKSIRLNRRGARAEWERGYQIGVALETSFIFFVVCAAFMNCERYPHQFLVAGMAIALCRISEHRGAQIQNSQPPAEAGFQPPPSVVPTTTGVARPRSALRRSRGLPVR
jgi:O-antigen ligase